MKTKIDDLDRAIHACLREDARMSSSEIARRLGYVSARAVRNRIDHLIERGLIAINAAAVPERLGFPINADVYIEAEPGRSPTPPAISPIRGYKSLEYSTSTLPNHFFTLMLLIVTTQASAGNRQFYSRNGFLMSLRALRYLRTFGSAKQSPAFNM